MKIKSSILLGACTATVLLCPMSAFAQVVINEIAWMGSTGNANAEWIELRNTSASSVSLEGWTLAAEDGSPSITLSGTIGASGFFLLERTSDESVSGVTADLIYTGVLGNAGETLVLKNAGGQSIDMVLGGENWQNIGGDNATKETAQKTTSGWITGAPTPRAANANTASQPDTPEDTDEETGTDTEASSGTSSGAGSSTQAPSSAPVARASAGKDKVVVVGVDTRFEGLAYDSGNRTIENARFLWNFGDGATAEGKIVMHRWQYPGRYAVVLEVSRFESKVSHRITVTAESAQFSFDVSTDGSVTLKNLSSRDVDLSDWRISDRGVTFTFSPNTILLKSGSIRLSPLALRFNASQSAELLYPDGSVAVHASLPASAEISVESADPDEEESVQAASSTELAQMVSKTISPQISTDTVESSEESPVVPEEPQSPPENIENVAAVALAAEKSDISALWWLGILLILVLGVVAVFAARHLRSKRAPLSRDNWNIIDDTDNEV